MEVEVLKVGEGELEGDVFDRLVGRDKAQEVRDLSDSSLKEYCIYLSNIKYSLSVLEAANTFSLD